MRLVSFQNIQVLDSKKNLAQNFARFLTDVLGVPAGLLRLASPRPSTPCRPPGHGAASHSSCASSVASVPSRGALPADPANFPFKVEVGSATGSAPSLTLRIRISSTPALLTGMWLGDCMMIYRHRCARYDCHFSKLLARRVVFELGM